MLCLELVNLNKNLSESSKICMGENLFKRMTLSRMFQTAAKPRLAFIPEVGIFSNVINWIVHFQSCMKFFPATAIEGNK